MPGLVAGMTSCSPFSAASTTADNVVLASRSLSAFMAPSETKIAIVVSMQRSQTYRSSALEALSRIIGPRSVALFCAEESSTQGRMFMKKMLLLATLLGTWPACGLAQTMEELVNDGKNTDNVLKHSIGFIRNSYSPLKLINKSNVKRLLPIWSTSLMNDWGQLSAPVVYHGVIYAITRKWTFPIYAHTG